MLEEFLTKVLVVLFGYAYPAFECFKMVEERPGEIEQLRFWCQYWIIVAIVTVIEMLAETVVSGVPLYDQVKLAFFVYLWYPKTKGSDLVYETFLRPLVMQYEPDIEQRLRHLRAKSGQFLMFYLKNFSDKGSTLFFEALNYVVSQGSRVSRTEVGIEPRGDQALVEGLLRRLRHDGLHSRRCGRRRCQTAAPAQVIEKKDCENLLKLEKQKETSSRRFMNETNNVNTENSNATDELQFVQLLLSLC